MSQTQISTDNALSGVCRVCGCTMEDGCHLAEGISCWWMDIDETLCSNPVCIAKVPVVVLNRMRIVELMPWR